MHALFVKFKPEASEEAFMEDLGPTLKAMRSSEGLVMKMFVEPEESRWGGVYLFTSKDAADAYLTSEPFETFRNSPTLSNVEVQHWPVDAEASQAFGTPSTPLTQRT